MRIFLDTSIFVAACASEIGGSRYLFAVAKIDLSFQLITNSYALVEAKRNILHKLPHSQNVLNSLITAKELLVTQDPPEALMLLASQKINNKDAPILAGALLSRSDILCTLDKKDFHRPIIKKWSSAFGISILTPGDILVHWRKNNVGNC